jgi:chromosome segregation ATPase
MAFMKRDVNVMLLLLIVVSILVFSGFTVYYQASFKDVSLEYKEKLEKLQQVTGDLAVQKKELNETYALRVKAEQDKQALDQSYKELSDERNQLENDKSTLQTELTTTKNDLADKSAQLQSVQNQLASTQSELSSVKSKKNSLEDDLEEVCAAYESATGSAHAEC